MPESDVYPGIRIRELLQLPASRPLDKSRKRVPKILAARVEIKTRIHKMTRAIDSAHIRQILGKPLFLFARTINKQSRNRRNVQPSYFYFDLSSLMILSRKFYNYLLFVEQKTRNILQMCRVDRE